MLITTAVGWLIDEWVTTLAGLIFIYNWCFNQKNKELAMASLTVVLMYALGHFVYAWLVNLPWEEQNFYRYSSRLMIYVIGVLFYAAITRNLTTGMTSKFIFANFFFAIFAQLIMHIDRNVIGLNKILEFFSSGKIYSNFEYESYWWLWDAYSLGLNLSAAAIILYLLLCEFVKEYICSRHS